MIDPKTGAIHLDAPAVTITPEFTATDFSKSPLAHLGGAVPGTRFAFQPVIFLGESFGGSLRFEGGVLRVVQFSAIHSEFGTSWQDWSEAKELGRKFFHEGLLATTFGKPPAVLVAAPNEEARAMRGYRFDWGVVRSFFDSKAGFSAIEVEYLIETK